MKMNLNWLPSANRCRKVHRHLVESHFAESRNLASKTLLVIFAGLLVGSIACQAQGADGGRKFAHSDSKKRYLHYIDLYDANNRKITPDSTQPFSTKQTCGRCHDYETISHGWHFNAYRSDVIRRQAALAAEDATGEDSNPEDVKPEDAESGNAAKASENPKPVLDGRPSEPWIWTDARTGTQLPLSYRDHLGLFNPKDIGISEYAMATQFGSRIAGGGFASEDERELNATADSDEPQYSPRWKLSGDLEVDCMACHAVSGAYDFENRRVAIGQENFAWASTAALRLGTVDGSVARIKGDVDPADEKVQAKLPKVTYDADRFESDNSVFMDLVRVPDNNSCYQCHSQQIVGDDGIEARWIHDEDVHLRAGMKCVDCHRNGIDHHIVRGFPGEVSMSDVDVTTLSCAGCHMGKDFAVNGLTEEPLVAPIDERAGRLGSPYPEHEGLPPIHFEKMSCTACHSGPAPETEAKRLMTSLSHALGEKAHRSGMEWPSIHGPVYLPTDGLSPGGLLEGEDHSPVGNHRVMWPAYWGKVVDGELSALPPDQVYDVTRRALRVRKDFVEELTLKGREVFDEKVNKALEAIEKEFDLEQAVYVSTGTVFARKDDGVETIEVNNPQAVGMVQWSMAHNVRPAGHSLGATGCLECHADDGLIFASTVTSSGPGPSEGTTVTMASLQGIADSDRQLWNQLFEGRKMFKVMVAGSLALLVLLVLISIAIRPRVLTNEGA